MVRRIVTVLIIFVLMSSVVLGVFILSKMVEDSNEEIELARFDIDGDGIFSISEQTLEQQLAFEKNINDSGEVYFIKFAFITSLAFGVLSSIVFLIIVSKKKKNGA